MKNKDFWCEKAILMRDIALERLGDCQYEKEYYERCNWVFEYPKFKLALQIFGNGTARVIQEHLSEIDVYATTTSLDDINDLIDCLLNITKEANFYNKQK